MANLSDSKQEGFLRIISGKYRHRKIKFCVSPGLRPTANRTRETLFNWIQTDIGNASVLDLFAGSGALGFEALSRGAREVVMVENQLEVGQYLNANIRDLSASGIKVVNQNVVSYLRDNDNRQFDFIFLDPPFNQGLIKTCCQLIDQHGWIKANTLVYLETEQQLDPVPIPASWQTIRSKSTSEVKFYLVQPNAG